MFSYNRFLKFLEKRTAEIVLDGLVIGSIGVLHPQVVLNYELKEPESDLSKSDLSKSDLSRLLLL